MFEVIASESVEHVDIRLSDVATSEQRATLQQAGLTVRSVSLPFAIHELPPSVARLRVWPERPWRTASMSPADWGRIPRT